MSFPNASVGTLALDLNTGGGTYRNFVFTGNVFRQSANGISYTGVLGSYPTDCSFTGNIGDNAAAANSWSQFANGGVAGWTGGIPVLTAVPSLFTDLNKDNGT